MSTLRSERQNNPDSLLPPQKLTDFIGQESVRREIELMLKDVRERGDVLEHVLLTGPQGIGKATLAYIIAQEIGVNLKRVSGVSVEKIGQLAGLLTSLERDDILLIEEINQLQPEILEYLYSAMDDFKLNITIDEGPQARTLKLNLPEFTLIGATTRADLLSAPLSARFGKIFSLDYYSSEDLQKFVLRSAAIINAPIDPSAAREIAARSGGIPRLANNLLRIAAPRLRMLGAIRRSAWDEIPDVIADELWALAEARPDFENLPTWLTQFQTATGGFEGSRRAYAAAEQGRSILRSVATEYSNEADRLAFAKMESNFFHERETTSLEEFGTFLADAIQQAAGFRKGVSRLPIAIHGDEILIGRHTRVSFNRTLRVPEDGKKYPLPAGFGRLPVLRVEDYAERVPASWLEQSGFIIPLYQREALFLQFSGVKWRPTIAKVAVGMVNAISGKEHDLKIRPHRQDYVVIPDQRWLDGINSGDGTVGQFVAMPLGKGYTIEAQLTDEERYGGFQLAIFDPKPNRFPEQDPRKQRAAAEDRKQRSSQAAQEDLLNKLPESSAQLIRTLQEQHYHEAAKTLGISEADLLLRLEELRSHFVKRLGEHGFDGVVPEQHLREAPRPVQFMPGTMDFMPKIGPALEMGIARGGTIKQQILQDTYGAESWDESIFRDVAIHIVNSEVYQQITGRKAPPTPVTLEHYQRCKIPWFSDYAEKAPSVSPVTALKRILSVGKIDKSRGVAKDEAPPLREIQPEEIIRIRTPTLEERWKALLERAVESSKSGHDRIAAREASLALDLSDKHPLPFFIRALSNHRLGNHFDAEADASACLKLAPDNMGALTIRAYSSLELGDTLLAKNDAEMLLTSHPDDYDGLYVRAEANLRLAQYNDAVGDAERILRRNPANRRVLRIRKSAMTKLLEEKERSRAEGSARRAPVSLVTKQPSFATLEQQLLEADHSVWGDQPMKSLPLWIAFREAAGRALIDRSQSVLFFQHYLRLLREASVFEIPLNEGWDSEWIALTFESAFGLANADRKQAEELGRQIGSKRSPTEQILRVFNRSALRWPAYDYVRQVVEDWRPTDYQEIARNGGGAKWLLESAESFFWAGIQAATEARQEPETLELIEFLDISSTRDWGDSRSHINLVRTTPLRCEASIKEVSEHPLLRIAAEKYRNNSAEAEIIGEFLEKLCRKQELTSERQDLDRDLFVCQLVQEGIHFGEQLLQNEPTTFARMLQTADGYAGDRLLAFYERTLSKVEDHTDLLNVTRALLEWQAEERGEVSSRYYGERLETLLNCIDAAIYLPWAEAAKDK